MLGIESFDYFFYLFMIITVPISVGFALISIFR